MIVALTIWVGLAAPIELEPSWQVKVADAQTVQITKDAVVVVGDTSVTVLDRRNGKSRWQANSREPGTVAAFDSVVLRVDPEWERVIAQDIGTGEEIWWRSAPDDVRLGRCPDHRTVLMTFPEDRGDNQPVQYAYDPADGRPLGQVIGARDPVIGGRNGIAWLGSKRTNDSPFAGEACVLSCGTRRLRCSPRFEPALQRVLSADSRRMITIRGEEKQAGKLCVEWLSNAVVGPEGMQDGQTPPRPPICVSIDPQTVRDAILLDALYVSTTNGRVHRFTLKTGRLIGAADDLADGPLVATSIGLLGVHQALNRVVLLNPKTLEIKSMVITESPVTTIAAGKGMGVALSVDGTVTAFPLARAKQPAEVVESIPKSRHWKPVRNVSIAPEETAVLDVAFLGKRGKYILTISGDGVARVHTLRGREVWASEPLRTSIGRVSVCGNRFIISAGFKAIHLFELDGRHVKDLGHIDLDHRRADLSPECASVVVQTLKNGLMTYDVTTQAVIIEMAPTDLSPTTGHTPLGVGPKRLAMRSNGVVVLLTSEAHRYVETKRLIDGTAGLREVSAQGNLVSLLRRTDAWFAELYKPNGTFVARSRFKLRGRPDTWATTRWSPDRRAVFWHAADEAAMVHTLRGDRWTSLGFISSDLRPKAAFSPNSRQLVVTQLPNTHSIRLFRR